jgi:hypothetical protein
MRTMKAVIATVALGAVGIATSMADPVYSANVVGFVNVTTYPGWNLIANPLNGTNNAINTILSSSVEGALVMKWVAASQTYSLPDTYLTLAADGVPDGWYDNDGNPTTTTLAPGDGFFFNDPNGTPLQVTFVGEVPQGSLSTSILPNYNVVSALTPSSPALIAANGVPVQEAMTYMTFDGQHQTYSLPLTWLTLAADGVADGWYDNDGNPVASPTPAPGLGFFLWSPSSSTLSWNMTFNVQ